MKSVFSALLTSVALLASTFTYAPIAQANEKGGDIELISPCEWDPSCEPPPPPQTEAKITARVLSAGGQAQRGMQVELYRFQHNGWSVLLETQTTGSFGYVQFEHLPVPGSYLIKVVPKTKHVRYPVIRADIVGDAYYDIQAQE